MANRALLISPTKLIKDTPLNGSLDTDLANSMIYTSQEMRIWQKLGTDLYNKLKADVEASTLTGNYLTLVNTWISPALVWWTLYDMIPFLRVRMVSHGLQIMNSEQGTAAGAQDVKPIIDKCEQTAQWYTQRLIEHLCHNTDLYPEYNTNSEDDVHPSTHNYTGGLNLYDGGKRKVYDYCWPWRE